MSTNNKNKPEFWETSFNEKQEMWGFEPAQSTIIARDFFLEKGLKTILVPGIGYGRNAQLFAASGMSVTGIEISQTAIDLLKKHYGETMRVYHGSVTEMPFDSQKYDGIFCYALIHLLNENERAKLIRDCFNQLSENGYMIFTMISKKATTYGTGKAISKDRYELFGGVNMFFYDEESVQTEFGKFGLKEIRRIEESYPFFLVICQKDL